MASVLGVPKPKENMLCFHVTPTATSIAAYRLRSDGAVMACVLGVAKLKEIITAVPSTATRLLIVANVSSNAILAGTLMDWRCGRWSHMETQHVLLRLGYTKYTCHHCPD
jgi:hypothetical protein